VNKTPAVCFNFEAYFVDELLSAFASKAEATTTGDERKRMEHRGVRYEIKMAIGKNQWTWIVHTSPSSRQGSIEGTRQAAIRAAERTINNWWHKKHGRKAARVAELSPRLRDPSPAK
jgi:hypothetical protein